MPHPQYQRPADYELFTLAEALARVAHSGQTRSGGEAYFEHVLRVAQAAWKSDGDDNWIASAIGYLHDTVEDTTITLGTLRDVGFPRELVTDVALLTRGEDETYDHYIDRLIEFGSDDALIVKLADLNDNLNALATSTFSAERQVTLRARWMNALGRVLAEQDRRDAVRQVREFELDRVLGEAA